MISSKTKLVAALGAFVFTAGLAASPAQAAHKKCPSLCRTVIQGCIAALPPVSICTGSTKKSCKKSIAKGKSLCKKNIVKDCKQSTVTTACSPSGAFLTLD